MAPRSKTQKQKAGQTKRTQRQRMAEYGLQEVTVYVPKDEAEGLRSRSSKLVAAARARSMLDGMNKEDVKALEALSDKDFEQFDVTQSSGLGEPHKDHIHPRTSKSADASPQAPQIPPSQPVIAPPEPAATSAPTAALAPAPQPSTSIQPQARTSSPVGRPAASVTSPRPSDDEMTAMLAKANGLNRLPMG